MDVECGRDWMSEGGAMYTIQGRAGRVGEESRRWVWQQALIKTAAGANSNILHPSLFTSFILTSVHNLVKSATCADSY